MSRVLNMYKKYASVCIMLLLSTLTAGCNYNDNDKEITAEVQQEAEEPGENFV